MMNLSRSKQVHIFFYAWFGSEAIDGKWSEWDHPVLPHWDKEERPKFDYGRVYSPPDEIASVYYPSRGPYSSMNLSVVREQMLEIKEAGVDVVVFSWWKLPASSDGARGWGVKDSTDAAAPLVLEAAAEAGIKVCFHLEPYKGRGVSDVREDIGYINSKYGHHRAFFYADKLPLFYVYDSYQLPLEDWRALLHPNGSLTVRGSELDGLFLGLYLQRGHERFATEGGFDGLYSYFASSGFSDGSRPSEWRRLSAWGRSVGKIFCPCVGPGYDDSRIRPWNAASWRYRAMGRYYEDMWRGAEEAGGVQLVAITSYNEWGEGTQIEPAASSPARASMYQTYGGNEKLFIELTRSLASRWRKAIAKEEEEEKVVLRKAVMLEVSRLHSLIQMKYECREGGREGERREKEVEQVEREKVKEEVRRLKEKVEELDLEVEEEDMKQLMRVFDDSAPQCTASRPKQEEEVRLVVGGKLSSDELKLSCGVCFSSAKVQDDEREEACMKCTGPLGRGRFEEAAAAAATAGAAAGMGNVDNHAQTSRQEGAGGEARDGSYQLSPPFQLSEFDKLREEIQTLLSKLAEAQRRANECILEERARSKQMSEMKHELEKLRSNMKDVQMEMKQQQTKLKNLEERDVAMRKALLQSLSLLSTSLQQEI